MSLKQALHPELPEDPLLCQQLSGIFSSFYVNLYLLFNLFLCCLLPPYIFQLYSRPQGVPLKEPLTGNKRLKMLLLLPRPFIGCLSSQCRPIARQPKPKVHLFDGILTLSLIIFAFIRLFTLVIVIEVSENFQQKDKEYCLYLVKKLSLSLSPRVLSS